MLRLGTTNRRFCLLYLQANTITLNFVGPFLYIDLPAPSLFNRDTHIAHATHKEGVSVVATAKPKDKDQQREKEKVKEEKRPDREREKESERERTIEEPEEEGKRKCLLVLGVP